jgi:DNA/RNA endonuclease G (NUC1)
VAKKWRSLNRVWPGLENYALENARQDDMLISVFTGPFYAKNDPVMYGVKIPITFWKVIAFIHDETNKLLRDRVHDVATHLLSA